MFLELIAGITVVGVGGAAVSRWRLRQQVATGTLQPSRWIAAGAVFDHIVILSVIASLTSAILHLHLTAQLEETTVRHRRVLCYLACAPLALDILQTTYSAYNTYKAQRHDANVLSLREGPVAIDIRRLLATSFQQYVGSLPWGLSVVSTTATFFVILALRWLSVFPEAEEWLSVLGGGDEISPIPRRMLLRSRIETAILAVSLATAARLPFGNKPQLHSIANAKLAMAFAIMARNRDAMIRALAKQDFGLLPCPSWPTILFFAVCATDMAASLCRTRVWMAAETQRFRTLRTLLMNEGVKFRPPEIPEVHVATVAGSHRSGLQERQPIIELLNEPQGDVQGLPAQREDHDGHMGHEFATIVRKRKGSLTGSKRK